jgi:uncharacterized protein
MRTDIEFDADGVCLRGWLYQPTGTGPHPLVVMAHGFSAVKEMGLDDYAEVFCAAGLAVLVYDNRNLGASDGLPRQEIDPVAQRRDYSHAITYARTLPGVDPQRIGVWGTSYTGGLVIIAAALDRRIKCVVSQVPYLHALETMNLVMPLEGWRGFERMIEAERVSRAAGKPPTMTSVCSDDPSKAPDSAGRLSWAYFQHYVQTGRAQWPNEITARSLELRLDYDALGAIAHVAPTPLLMIVAADDDITPTRIALAAFDRALEPKRLVLIPGHHYRPYREAFEQSSQAARDWFLAHL